MFGETFQNCTGTLEQLKSSETFRTLFWNISECSGTFLICLGTSQIVLKIFLDFVWEYFRLFRNISYMFVKLFRIVPEH